MCTWPWKLLGTTISGSEAQAAPAATRRGMDRSSSLYLGLVII